MTPDILARLSIHLLSEPAPSYVPLLQPLLRPNLIPQSLIVILLDWNEPWSWIQQLRDWIILIREVTASLPDDSKLALEETMRDWQERRRGTSAYDGGGASIGNDSSVTIPLSQGEWDEALGLPLCVVCQNVGILKSCRKMLKLTVMTCQANNINSLEGEKNWREEDFDFVLQSLRTILMKREKSPLTSQRSSYHYRWGIPHIHLTVHAELTSYTHTFFS